MEKVFTESDLLQLMSAVEPESYSAQEFVDMLNRPREKAGQEGPAFVGENGKIYMRLSKWMDQ